MKDLILMLLGVATSALMVWVAKLKLDNRREKLEKEDIIKYVADAKRKSVEENLAGKEGKISASLQKEQDALQKAKEEALAAKVQLDTLPEDLLEMSKAQAKRTKSL